MRDMASSVIPWSEVQSQPEFNALPPEKKLDALNKWKDYSIGLVESPEEQDIIEAGTEFEKSKLLGEPLANSLDEYLPVFKARKAADQRGFFSQMGGALKTGLSDVTTGLGVTFDKLTGDNEELAQGMVAMNETQRERQLNKTTRDIELEKALAENAKQFKEAKGFWPTTKELIDYAGIAVTNPVAMTKMALESAPNALISIGATTAGGILGAAGGPAGLAAGAAAGGAAANIPMEIPGAIHQSLMEATQGQAANWDAAKIKEFLDANPQVTEAGLNKGVVRGAAIGLVEGLTAGIAGRVATIPERAAQKAMLIDVGRKIGKDIATPTEVADYLKAGGEVAKRELAKVGAKTIEGYSMAQRVGLIAGAEAIETVGEGVGEFSAQKAAGEETDPTAIFQEMAAGRVLGGAAALGARLASLPQTIAQAGPEAQQAASNLVEAQNLNAQAGQNPDATAATAAAGVVINEAFTNLSGNVEAAPPPAEAEEPEVAPQTPPVEEQPPAPTNLPPTEETPQTQTPETTPDAVAQDEIQEAGGPPPVQGKPSQPLPAVQTQEGAAQREGQGEEGQVTLPPQGVVPTESLPEGQPTPGGVGTPPPATKSEAAERGRAIARKALAAAEKNALGLPPVGDIIDRIESRIVLPARSGRKGKGEYDAINASSNPDKNKVFVSFPGKKVSPKAYTIDVAAAALGYGTDIDRFVTDVLQALENRRAAKGQDKTNEARDKIAVAQLEAFNADKDLGQDLVNLDDLVPGSTVDVAGTKLTVEKANSDEDGRTTSVSFKPSERYGRVEVFPEDNLKSNEVINPVQEGVSDFAPSEPAEEPAAKPAEELDLGPTESKKPVVRGATEKPQAPNPLAELQQAKAEGEAEQAQAKLPLTPKEKLQALDQEEADLLAKFRKSLGQTNVGFNPETFGIAVQLAGVAVRKGAVRFEQFAQYMKEVLPDLWDSIKDELASVWYRAAQDNEALEMPPGRQQIKDILDNLSQPPVAEEIVEEEEVPVVEPAPSQASPEALRTPIGFGSYENKTVEFLLANDPGYLFNTLFDANATAKADPAKLAAIREIVRQLPEYKRYLASQAKTKEQLAAERTVAVETSIENLRNIAPEASVTVAESGAVQVKKPSDATKSVLKKFGFVYNSKASAFETKDYAAVQEMGEYLAATDERKAMRDSPIEKKRVEIRAALDEADDESRNAVPFSSTRIPKPSPMERSILEFYQKAVRATKISLQTAQNQLTDALSIALAKKNGKPMYLLGSQAGYGKTYVIASALKEMQDNGAINDNSRVIFFTLNKRLIKQARKDMGNLYDGKVEFKTYSNLDNFTEEDFSPSDVLIFDEAHNIRYSVTGAPSARAKKAENMIEKAAFTLFSTATPYESVEQMRFLWPTGVFNELKGTFFQEDSEEKGWKDFAVAAGAEPKGNLVTFNAKGQDVVADQTFAREFLRKKGMFSYRSSNIPEGMAESSLAGVEGDAEWASVAQNVTRAFEQFPLTSNDKGYVTNLLKRILEASKMGRAAELARKELEEDPNKRVVIFTETKSESIKSLAEFSELAAAMAADPKMRIPEGFPQLPNVIKAFAYMHDVLGLQEINFPSVQDFFQKEFGAGNVVFYTGSESEAQRVSSQESWEKGEPRLMVATMAAGGTGLSLHDTSEGGKFPRVQISVNLPWRASELEQVSKRTARSGMTSKAKAYWLFANNLFNENKLASTVASRLSGLSFLVTGQSSSTAKSMANYEWEPLTNTLVETEASPLSQPMDEPVTEAAASFFSADLPEGEPKGKVSRKDFEEGMRIVESLIRKARVVVVEDTRENLLKREDIPEEVKITIRKGAQGAYYQGRAIIVRDGIQATSYTTSHANAAAAVIFHEMLHYGMDVLRYDTKFADIYNQWRSMVRENVTPEMLDNLARNPGYRQFAGWADSAKIRVRAEEEVFVRQMESLFRRKGNLAFREQNLLQRIKSWIGRMLERLFGVPIEGRLKDEILESWGKKIINAVQISNVMDGFDGNVEAYAGEDTEGTTTQRRGKDRISTFNKDDQESVEEFMEGNGPFDKLKQFLGLKKGGEMGKVEKLAPLKDAARNEIGFEDDSTGAPVVTPEATQKAKELAEKLLDPDSKFGAEYQSKYGVESAATAVLQMELLRYGLALAAKNDSSLLVALRSNWNGVMLGAYVSATSAGRVLNVRSHYVNQVMKTIDMMDKAQKTEATRKINELGVSEDGAETFVTSLQNVIKNLQYAEERREELLKAMLGNVNAPEFERKSNPFGWLDSAMDEIGMEKKALFTAILRDLREISELSKNLKTSETAANAAEASILDDIGNLEFDIPSTPEAIREKMARVKQRLNENLNKWFQSEDEQSDAEPGVPEDDSSGEEDADVEDAEDANDATEAAKKVIENLKAFLARKYKNKKPGETIYQKIKKIVDAAIANPDGWDFAKFKEEATKELGSLEIDKKVLSELLSRSYTVFTRYQQKDAERIAASLLKEKAPSINKTPQKAEQLRKLVKKFLVNKDRLPYDSFIQKLTEEIDKIGGIEEGTAKKLAEAAYKNHTERRKAQLDRKFSRIREALLNGSNETLAKELLKEKNADASDPVWRIISMKKLLVNSGLSQMEASEALRRFSQEEIDTIFGLAEGASARMTAERADAFVTNFIKRYERQLASPPKKRTTAQESLRSLVRAQVRVPLPQDLFVAEAARFGATQEQALRLYNLARVEADMLPAEGKQPTMLQKLVKHILSRPALANDPVARNLAIENFLRHNGYSDAMIASSKSWIQAAFEDFIKKAKTEALDKHVAELRKRAAQENIPSTFGVVSNPFLLTGKAKQQLDKDLSLIRKGLGDFEIDPQQALAKELGYTGFRPEDYKSLGELDLKITRAIEDGRQHDVSLGLKELYELLSRRRAPKSLVEVAGISYINSALGGLGTLGVNVISPAGAFLNRVMFDLGRALVRGRIDEALNIGKIAVESLKKIARETEFGLLSGASNVAMNNVIQEVTTLQGELIAARRVVARGSKASLMDKLKARYTIAAAYTGIISRTLMTADHVWSSVLQNYFLKVQSMNALIGAGNLTAKEFVPMVYSIQTQEQAFLDFNNQVISAFAQKADELLKTGNATKDQLLQLVSDIEIPEGLSDENRVFIEDFKGDMRRVVTAFEKPETLRRQLTFALRQATNNARLRTSDRINRGIYLTLQKQISPAQAEAVLNYVDKESDYEMGTHRGEKSPMLDVVNTFAQLVRDVGQSVKTKNPILGTMLFGFFGIPVNLFNRALWLSPYGFVRYFLKKSIKVNSDQFYQQSMQTQAQMRQRLIEAFVGTAAIGIMLLFKGDEDDEGFNVTLAGPSNKTEQDAWRKKGHRQGSFEYVTKDGKVISFNWARGPLEPFKIAALAVGALDDMRLNRKLGDKNLPSDFSDYFSAVAYGWSKQAAFFGVKNTVGAFLEVNPEANIAGNLLYKLNPFIPFSGTIKSMENMLVGPDRFRGRTGAFWLNLPIARSMLTERAVNALGDPQGYVPTDAWSTLNDRAWYNGIPLMVSGAPTGSDKRIYDFILDRGTGPGIPQRSILENQNGIMPDRDWLDYVAARGRIVKSEMIRQMSRLERMDDEDLSKAFGEISSKATREAKRRFGYK